MTNRKCKIEIEHNPELFGKIPMNFIYNRFDLQNDQTTEVLLLRIQEQATQYIPVKLCGNTAFLGVELTPVSSNAIKQAARFLFSKYGQIDTVSYKNGMTTVGDWSQHNYFVLEFPKSIEDLNSRMSADHRRKMANRMRVIERDYGKIEFLCYKKEEVPDSVMERYFELKNASHNRDYGLSSQEYLDTYFVSHVYVLTIADQVEAVRLECEQGDHVYDENHTYNMALNKHSPGLVAHYLYLKTMIDSDKKMLFMSGGNYDYKRRFGSQELQVYDCAIYRSGVKRAVAFTKRQLRCVKRQLLNRQRT